VKNNKTILFLLSLLAFSQLLSAASFDCTKAVSRVEKSICSEPLLSELDTLLSRTYKKVLTHTSSRQAVKASQYKWLKIRNKCDDDDCLKNEYLSRIIELAHREKALTVTGSYTRYYEGKPAFHFSDIDIVELMHNTIYLHGVAIWIGDARKGIVHLGEIDGSFSKIEDQVFYHDEEGCKLTIHFEKNALSIDSNDSAGCWGWNVTFDGYYRKIK